MSIKDLKTVKSFDIDKYDGIKVKIEAVELTPIEVKNFGNGDKEVQQIVVKTENIADKGEKEIQVIEYISLKKDSETGKFGIPDSKKSNAQKMLAYFEADNFEELVGKEVRIVKKLTDKGTFLGFHYGV
jgi:hypothetical protein